MNELDPVYVVRRTLSKVGWGLLLFCLAVQFLPLPLALIPDADAHEIPVFFGSYAIIYIICPLFLLLCIRSLPKGTAPGLPLSGRALLRSAVVVFGGGYLMNYITLLPFTLLDQLGVTSQNPIQNQVEAIPFWMSLLFGGLLAPIFEELIFRKLLLDRLRPLGDRAAIWISAVAFGLFHANLYQLIYAVFLGLLFAGIVLKTGKIWHTMVLHSVMNTGSLLLSTAVMAQDMETTSGMVISSALGLVLILSMVLAVVIFHRYRKTYRFTPSETGLSTGTILKTCGRAPGMVVFLLLSLLTSLAVPFLL